MPAGSLADRLRQRIDDSGPLGVSEYIGAALYDPTDGFYAVRGQAGRRGDFLTAPEVGPLFGAVVARAVDAWWVEAGEPPDFVVAEHAAGPGTLGRSIAAADSRCRSTGALRWVMIEPSASQRTQHLNSPGFESHESVDSIDGAVAVVFANELLDNLPFDLVRGDTDGWHEVLVGLHTDRFCLVDGPRCVPPTGAPPRSPGTTLPVHTAAAQWLAGARASAPNGRVVVIDYMAETSELVERGMGWLRTYRSHESGFDWLVDPGSCDITTDLALEQLGAVCPPSTSCSQAAFLHAHGIDELVEQGRRIWESSAHIGDLAALKARSRIGEANALLDPAGMGGFTVLEW